MESVALPTQIRQRRPRRKLYIDTINYNFLQPLPPPRDDDDDEDDEDDDDGDDGDDDDGIGIGSFGGWPGVPKVLAAAIPQAHLLVLFPSGCDWGRPPGANSLVPYVSPPRAGCRHCMRKDRRPRRAAPVCMVFGKISAISFLCLNAVDNGVSETGIGRSFSEKRKCTSCRRKGTVGNMHSGVLK